MKLPSVGLNFICKNEEKVVERMLLSAYKAGLKTWVVTDTGSDDSTILQIEHLAREYGVKLHLEKIEWTGFADARNSNLLLAREVEGIDFWLQLDCDETVEKVGELETAEADLVHVQLHNEGDGFNIWAARMLKHGTELFFFGKVHEGLQGPADYKWMAGRTNAYRIMSYCDGYRTISATRGQQNYDLSKLQLAELPGNPRATFYAALSAEGLGLIEEAIELFKERAAMESLNPIMEEEAWFAQLRVAYLLATQGDPLAPDLLFRAYARRPHRTEPLAVLAFYWEDQGFPEMAKGLWPALRPWPVQDHLFVDAALYEPAP